MDNNQLNQDMNSLKQEGKKIPAKTRRLGLMVGVGCGVAALAVAGGVAAAALNGAFLSKPAKVVAAGANTFESMMIVDDLLSFSELAASKEYTMELGMEYETVEGKLAYIADGKKKGLSVSVGGQVQGINLDVTADMLLDEKALQLMAPIIGNTVYSYDYTTMPKGELFQQADEEAVKLLNEALQQMYDYEAADKDYKKELQQAILDEIENMDFEAVESENFEIDGKDKNCKGYETTLKGKNINHILDNLYGDYDDLLGEDYKASYEEMKASIAEMNPIKMTFYLDGMNYAAVILKSGDSKVEILFQGGDRPTQNMKIKVDGEVVFRIKGSTEDDVEKSEWYVEDEKVVTLRRDKSSNVTKVTIGEEEVSFKLRVNKERNSAELKIYDISNGEETLDNLSIRMKIKKGASLPKMEGDVFDVGNATMEEFEKVYEKIQENLGYFLNFGTDDDLTFMD